MFDHVTIRVADRKASERFYNAVLAQLGIDETYRTESFSEWQDFMVAQAQGEHPQTRGLHVGFVSPTREQVEKFWRAGTEGGYTSDGEPGPRPEYGEDYYSAFLLDPDGNSVEAVHGGDRGEGAIDHLWIRVADLAAAKLERVLTNDPVMGVLRHADAGYEAAEKVAAARSVRIPMAPAAPAR